MALAEVKDNEEWKTLFRPRKSPEDPENIVAKEKLYQTTVQVALEGTRLNTSPRQAVSKTKSY